jgi:hypothetical protein
MIDCVVRNFTNADARIEIPNTVELPEAFGLTFDGGYSLRPFRIAWRTSKETGVEFLETRRQGSKTRQGLKSTVSVPQPAPAATVTTPECR